MIFPFATHSLGRFLLLSKETGQDAALGGDPARAPGAPEAAVSQLEQRHPAPRGRGLHRHPSEIPRSWDGWG